MNVSDCEAKYLVFVEYSEYERSGFFFATEKAARARYEEEKKKGYGYPTLCKIIE